MATMRDIKRRIRGVRNIQQITKAMKMVAAARLRRAEDRMRVMRPYAAAIEATLAGFADELTGDENPLLARIENPGRVCIMAITSDRGLCGGFNANVIRTAVHLIEENSGREVSVIPVGRKGYRFFRARSYTVAGHYEGVSDNVSYNLPNAMSDFIAGLFFERRVEELWLVYNEFRSVLQQEMRVRKLLPFDIEDLRKQAGFFGADRSSMMLVEPDEAGLCDKLVPRYLSTQIFRSLLESQASELAARMTAMETATENAAEVIESLTQEFNQARQAAITQEISEIVGGSGGLRRA